MVRYRTILIALAAAVAAGRASADTLLLEFTSPTCGPCRAMRPVMQQLATAGYAVREVDISREPNIASQYGVQAVPTFIVLVDGQERARWVGGDKTVAQLSSMIHTAAAIAVQAQSKASTPAATPLIGLIGDSTLPLRDGQTAQALREPQPGRVVPVDAQPLVSRVPETAAAPAAQAGVSGEARLIAATVRLTVQDPQGNSTGSGTIVDAREGKALVLTCGHIFRDSKGQGTISIALFTPTPQGAELRNTVEGTLIDFDLDRDLALVCFVTNDQPVVAPVAPLGTEIRGELPASSVGCEHGANPTVWATRITAVNRYQGPPNIEAAGAPVEGRSGGGLFNGSGQLIGVCNAADPQGNEGLYAGLTSIHQKLDTLNLSFVHQSPSLGRVAPAAAESHAPLTALAAGTAVAASSNVQVRGQDPATGEAAAVVGAAAINPFASIPGAEPSSTGAVTPLAHTPTPVDPTLAAAGAPAPQAAAPPLALGTNEMATLAEINRRGAESEVICIITPRTPGGRSEVIKLNRASPAFVQALNGSSGASAPPANASR